MIVLHGTWKAPIEIQERGDFFLWGESSVPAKRKCRRTPLPHPFKACQDDIFKIITSIDFANKGAKKARKDSAIIILPSISNSPQASPDLIREDDSENGKEKVGLSAWKIEGLSLPPEDAVSLLSMFSGFWTGIEGFAVGTDFRFWSKVSKSVMELLSKQHFVPGIFSSNGLSFARWQYVLNDQDDITRMSMLAGGMPPICRAMDGLPNNPEAILTGFVNSAIDGCIRRWIPLSEMTSNTMGLSSAWLESLATGQPIKTNMIGIKNL